MMPGLMRASMQATMQDWPMTTDRFIEHAARWHAGREVVSRLEDGSICRCSYENLRNNAARLSNALLAAGIKPGDRVATLAMNGAWHMSAWYAISGIGAVCHTLNPRFSEDQLVYIIKHAEDRIIIADGAFAPLLARLLPRSGVVERVVFLAPPLPGPGIAIPVSMIEDFVAGASQDCTWGGFGENTAGGLCYTSGTTGNPKGVLYSHRSNTLHALSSIQPDALNLSVRDVVMPVVPMYHANAWGLVFSVPAVGAKMVLPGHRLDGASLCSLMASEGVTMAAGVPTVWLALIQYMKETGIRLPKLARVVVGGATMPDFIARAFDEFGIDTVHAWGMTELSPIGSFGTLTPATAMMEPEERLSYRLKQGRVMVSLDMRIVDEQGKELPRDGRTMGALQVRGGTACARYYKQEESALTTDGFFDTGDIATIDAHGFMLITDRAKDIIKSGGEFISSIEIENAALTHPSVAISAVIGIPHPKWDERPMLIVELKPGEVCTADGMRAHLAKLLPKHWLPDDIRFVKVMPLGATGKLDKKLLRAAYRPSPQN